MSNTMRCAVLLAVVLCPVADASVWYVKTDGNNGSNGQSWGTAFLTIRHAVDTATSGDEVWVKAGTYQGNHGTAGGAANVVIMKSGVDLYGGFAGTETAIGQRIFVDVDPYPEDTGPAGPGPEMDVEPIDPANETNIDGQVSLGHRGVYAASNAILDGFTVRQGGTANSHGSGLYATMANGLTISHCSFEDNENNVFGGGAYIVSAVDVTISNCMFLRNKANSGGGLSIFSSPANSVVIDNCAVIDSESHNAVGGGIRANGSSPTVINTTFVRNRAAPDYVNGDRRGGGIFIDGASSASFTNCWFIKNTGPEGGGGLYAQDTSSPTLTACTFLENTATGSTGGEYS